MIILGSPVFSYLLKITISPHLLWAPADGRRRRTAHKFFSIWFDHCCLCYSHFGISLEFLDSRHRGRDIFLHDGHCFAGRLSSTCTLKMPGVNKQRARFCTILFLTAQFGAVTAALTVKADDDDDEHGSRNVNTTLGWIAKPRPIRASERSRFDVLADFFLGCPPADIHTEWPHLAGEVTPDWGG